MAKRDNRRTVPLTERLFLSRQLAAEMLSISVRKLDYLIADKEIEIHRVDGRVLIPTTALLKFAAKGTEA